MSSTTKKTIDIKKSLVDAILAGLIALIVFGPIVGVVLDGYSFNLETDPGGVDHRHRHGRPLCLEPVPANPQGLEDSRRF